MRVLLDENVQRALTRLFRIHDADHVLDLGWDGVINGELLRRTGENGYSVFVTADKNLRFQQRLTHRTFAVVVIDVHPNDFQNQAACVPLIERLASRLQPGEVVVVQAPHSET